MIDENRIDNLAMKRIAEEVADVFDLTSCDVTMLATTIGRISGMIDLATDIKNEIFRELPEKLERENE